MVLTQIKFNDEEFVPLAEVAKKWNRSINELLKWAMEYKFDLYCRKPSRPRMGDLTPEWFLIGPAVHYFYGGKVSITILHEGLRKREYPFGITPIKLPKHPSVIIDPLKYHLEVPPNPVLPPQVNVTIFLSDLYLHRYEIRVMEEYHPELLEKEESKTDRKPKVQTKSLSKTKEEKSSKDLICGHIDSASSSPSRPSVDEAATDDNELSLSTDIDKKGNARPERSNRAKQQKKKKEKPELHIIDGSVEQLRSVKDDKKLSHIKQAVSGAGYLRLPQVLEVIPVSKSTWWEGVKSGRFPQPVKLSPRCTAWKASDILALLEDMNKESE